MGVNTEFSSLGKWIDDGLLIAPLPSRKEAHQREGVEFGGAASSLRTGIVRAESLQDAPPSPCVWFLWKNVGHILHFVSSLLPSKKELKKCGHC